MEKRILCHIPQFFPCKNSSPTNCSKIQDEKMQAIISESHLVIYLFRENRFENNSSFVQIFFLDEKLILQGSFPTWSSTDDLIEDIIEMLSRLIHKPASIKFHLCLPPNLQLQNGYALKLGDTPLLPDEESEITRRLRELDFQVFTY